MSLISSTFSKVTPIYTIHSYDLGFLFEINGCLISDPTEWKTIRIVANNETELLALLSEAGQLPKP
jgi:hypothetical protein